MAVTANANALVSLAEQKEWLVLTATDMDDFLQRAINDWSDAVESRCGRVIRSMAHEDEVHAGGKKAILLRNTPVTAISAVEIDGAALGTEDYTVDETSGILRMKSGKAFGGGPGSVLVSYTGGYATPPGDLKRAIKQVVALEYYLGPGRKALAKRGESNREGNVTYERGPKDQEGIIEVVVKRYGRR